MILLVSWKKNLKKSIIYIYIYDSRQLGAAVQEREKKPFGGFFEK